ncbi:MAG: DUF2911 domain-containing protein [Gemmatimonadaceae bacterium]|nr:DUF2911 domain-containing protein [Gemmatimonadaceae bacterium]
MKRFLVLVFVIAACKDDGPAESYGFVATLGNDTVSVEQVTRSPHQLTTEAVDRFPLVRMRQTAIDLADDGKLTGMVMTVRTPSGRTPAERERTVVAEFTPDSVRISITDSAGVTRRNFRTGGALTVPHIEMLYSVIELEIASAMRLSAAAGKPRTDSIPFRQFYPDRDIGPRFVLHGGWVHPTAGDTVVLRHDWLSGSGDVTIDSAGRMLTYSGARSTYKVAVRRITTVPDIAAIGARFAAAEQKAGAAQLSVRDTARGTIGSANISIDYGRPLARGRNLLGNVITFDRVWRTGANAATQFTTTAPIAIEGLAVPAGTYTLWTVPHSAANVELIVNGQSGQWGTEYSSARDLGSVKLQTDSATVPVEKFTMSVVPSGAGRGALVLEWGTFRWVAGVAAR